MSIHISKTTPPVIIDAQDALTLPVQLVYPVARCKLADKAPAGASPIIELRVSIDENSTLVHLADPAGDSIKINTHDTETNITRTAGGWIHIDAPGIISCSISKANTNSPELIYAKTTLLGQLGLGGGRFEPPVLR